MKMSLRKKRIQRIPKGTLWEFSWQPWVGGAGKEGNICLNGINDRKNGTNHWFGQPGARAGEERSAPGKILAAEK